MDIAEIIVDDFLYQNAFSKHDYTCPVSKVRSPPISNIHTLSTEFAFCIIIFYIHLIIICYFQSIGMLKTMITFYEHAMKAIADSPAEKKVPCLVFLLSILSLFHL